ncbi:hypothetical protein DL93DRAFT_2076674 [Clavulina sp. PMI_390]|nr:hypothetical protein DL93DRAFT_2076674 [Clavulina sp. PMI_390]
MLADREHFTQYFWGSTLLVSHFARARRLEESLLLMAAVGPLATACGMLATPRAETVHNYSRYLLPAPATNDAALNVIWLAHSVVLVDQSSSAIAGVPPALICEEDLIPSFDRPGIQYPWFKMPMADEEEVTKIWQSDAHLNLSTTVLFNMVLTIHREKNRSIHTEYSRLVKAFIRFHDSRLPSLSDAISDSNPHTLLSHATLYGTSLIFHRMFAKEDVEAKLEMLRSAEKLVCICKQLHVHRHSYDVHSSLVPMVHMMNAVRVYAQELRRLEVRENAKLSTEYCNSIEVLLEFLSGMTALYPVWEDSPVLLKDPLTVAMEGLKI